MHATKLESFNIWISYALSDLARLADRDAPMARGIGLDMVMASLRHALRRANEMRDAARKALCFRLMNRLRAELRRAS
ncbi:hypothetical protein [Bosea vaviloviae]|uniref:Uncharacterized protein n=1 Tax=Bosea vaviloviae TaxID=1526658 RepID=A0A0N1N1M8_9HYPH|nr:hypothetical protein [Bosea vaviloviae]KPH79352.1 hypothetical protein AE618_18825 [Bosea vaviloviae]